MTSTFEYSQVVDVEVLDVLVVVVPEGDEQICSSQSSSLYKSEFLNLNSRN